MKTVFYDNEIGLLGSRVSRRCRRVVSSSVQLEKIKQFVTQNVSKSREEIFRSVMELWHSIHELRRARIDFNWLKCLGRQKFFFSLFLLASIHARSFRSSSLLCAFKKWKRLKYYSNFENAWNVCFEFLTHQTPLARLTYKTASNDSRKSTAKFYLSHLINIPSAMTISMQILTVKRTKTKG